MVPYLMLVVCLLLALTLSWRAMTQGGPIADWFWVGAGGLAIAIFGGELVHAGLTLYQAIALENAWEPRPPVPHAHVIAMAVLMFVRPQRKRAAA